MNRKTSLALAITCAFSSLPAWSQDKAKGDEEAIKTVIRKLWLSPTDPDFSKSITFPYLQISVRDKNKIAFKSKADMQEQIRIFEAAEEKRAKTTGARETGGPYPLLPPILQISQLKITKANSGLAYVSYNLTRKPNPRYVEYGLDLKDLKLKPPVALLAVLMKEKGAWKISFMTRP